MESTRAEIERVLRAMDAWRAQSEAVRIESFRCPRCKAAPGARCVGRTIPTPYVDSEGNRAHHSPRDDRMCRAMSSREPARWREDLEQGAGPAFVLREIKLSALYRHLRASSSLG